SRNERVVIPQALQGDHLDDAAAIPEGASPARSTATLEDRRRVGDRGRLRCRVREPEPIQARVRTQVRSTPEPRYRKRIDLTPLPRAAGPDVMSQQDDADCGARQAAVPRAGTFVTPIVTPMDSEGDKPMKTIAKFAALIAVIPAIAGADPLPKPVA